MTFNSQVHSFDGETYYGKLYHICHVFYRYYVKELINF